MEINLRDDIRLVQNARRNSFTKKGEITVGAVIQTKSGRKFTGCNIEIDSSETIWAEKVALLKAISEGEKEFDYIVVMGGKKEITSEKYIPSEACLKFIKNFVDEEFKIYTIYENKVEEYKLINFLSQK